MKKLNCIEKHPGYLFDMFRQPQTKCSVKTLLVQFLGARALSTLEVSQLPFLNPADQAMSTYWRDL